MDKDTIKNYLIISFVVVEILSMLFNYNFVTLNIGAFEYHFNFSVVFFCLGFFIVDVIADQFSPFEANKFIFYKLYSQLLFLLFGQIAISVYGLEGTQIAHLFNKSPWMVFSGLLATYAGFHTMSTIMSHVRIRIYQGASRFKRYLCSTIPGEFLFSLVFTLLCFYTNTSFDELMHVFVTSAIAKLILSVLFASIMEILVKWRLSPKVIKTAPIKFEVN